MGFRQNMVDEILNSKLQLFSRFRLAERMMYHVWARKLLDMSAFAIFCETNTILGEKGAYSPALRALSRVFDAKISSVYQ